MTGDGRVWSGSVISRFVPGLGELKRLSFVTGES